MSTTSKTATPSTDRTRLTTYCDRADALFRGAAGVRPLVALPAFEFDGVPRV